MSNILKTKVSVYKDIRDIKSSHTATIGALLDRIKVGGKNEATKKLVEEIRACTDDEIKSSLKARLTSVTFSGVFTERYDDMIVEHSGLICLDFDKVPSVELTIEDFKKDQYCFAAWVSPSGNGVKVLVKIAEGMKHREHFAALKKRYKTADKSGVNPSRVCYESYDPNIYINHNSDVFKEYVIEQDFLEITNVGGDDEIFTRLITWLEAKDDHYSKGGRNNFIFKLASACCRFGIEMGRASLLISERFLTKGDGFSKKEAMQTINSAYRTNKNKFDTASFENERVIERSTLHVVSPQILEEGYKLQDVIYANDVMEGAYNIYDNGFEAAETTHISQIDTIFKWKKRQLTLLSGIGNAGKSAIIEYLSIVKAMKSGWKTALFSPENYPSNEFFFQLTEVYLGADCSPDNPNRPSREEFEAAYKVVNEHFFYIYPESLAPTPELIKHKFFELIIKEGVDIVILDPINQLMNDYSKYGGRDDRFLETVLGDFGKFARENDVCFVIVAHPHKMSLGQDGNYPCPNVFDLAGGAMYNNKCDNILIYHRPYNVTDPMSPICELHTKKAKKTRLFKKGTEHFEFDWKRRRFTFNGIDPLEKIRDKPTTYSSQTFPF
jgi:twinkle protein